MSAREHGSRWGAEPPSEQRRVRVLERDPDLAAGIAVPEREALAAQLVVPAVEFPAGEVHEIGLREHEAPFGLLVLDGLLGRHIRIGEAEFVELLGPSDVLRPWVSLQARASTVPRSRWTALDPALIAVLGGPFVTAARRFPELTAELMDRLALRSRWLAAQLLLPHLRRVDERLLRAFELYADRWGRVTRDGIVLPLRLTHELLAKMVGARRPSVTSALSDLARGGVVERRDDGTWLLRRDRADRALGAGDQGRQALRSGHDVLGAAE